MAAAAAANGGVLTAEMVGREFMMGMEAEMMAMEAPTGAGGGGGRGGAGATGAAGRGGGRGGAGATGAAGRRGGGGRGGATVGRCALNPVESRIGSAWFRRLELTNGNSLSHFAFNLKLCRYTTGAGATGAAGAGVGEDVGAGGARCTRCLGQCSGATQCRVPHPVHRRVDEGGMFSGGKMTRYYSCGACGQDYSMVTEDGSDEARVVGAKWCYEGRARQMSPAMSLGTIILEQPRFIMLVDAMAGNRSADVARS